MNFSAARGWDPEVQLARILANTGVVPADPADPWPTSTAGAVPTSADLAVFYGPTVYMPAIGQVHVVPAGGAR